MKTAKDYLREAIGYEPTMQRIDYADALAAVQAALDEAGSVRQQVRQALADYFEDVLPEPHPATPLPEQARIVLGSRGPFPTCGDCLKLVADCRCVRPPF